MSTVIYEGLCPPQDAIDIAKRHNMDLKGLDYAPSPKEDKEEKCESCAS